MFPGRCERCGGRQEWTIYDDESYVRCIADCSDQLVIEGFEALPPDSEDPGYGFAREVEGTKRREGVVPPEGGAANVGEEELSDQPF